MHRCCHGLRGVARRRRARELHALSELHDLALLFPSVRPRGAAIESLADRVAASMGDEPRDCTAAEVEEGAVLLSSNERLRLIRAWTGRYSNRWHSICSIVGDAALCEHALVASAVRAAVADRVVCPSGVAAELEDGSLERSPAAALALALSPPAVWSYEEALDSDASLVAARHIARVRVQAGRLGRRLPFDGSAARILDLGRRVRARRRRRRRGCRGGGPAPRRLRDHARAPGELHQFEELM